MTLMKLSEEIRLTPYEREILNGVDKKKVMRVVEFLFRMFLNKYEVEACVSIIQKACQAQREEDLKKFINKK